MVGSWLVVVPWSRGERQLLLLRLAGGVVHREHARRGGGSHARKIDRHDANLHAGASCIAEVRQGVPHEGVGRPIGSGSQVRDAVPTRSRRRRQPNIAANQAIVHRDARRGRVGIRESIVDRHLPALRACWCRDRYSRRADGQGLAQGIVHREQVRRTHRA